MKTRVAIGAAATLAAALTLFGGGTRIASGGGNCSVVPTLRDSNVNQGIGGSSAAGYSPLVRGKDTLVRFYLSNPSCSNSQLQIMDASLSVSIRNADGTTTTPSGSPFSTFNPIATDSSGNFPVISTYSAAAVAADTTSDPRFLIPGYQLVANDDRAFTATFTLNGHFRVGNTGASQSFGPMPATASFDQKTRALRILFVKMGDPNGIPSGTTCPIAGCSVYGPTQHPEFGTAAISKVQNAVAALSRAAPVPGAPGAGLAAVGDLTGTAGGIRYSFNIASSCASSLVTCGMLNLNALSDSNGPLLQPPNSTFPNGRNFCGGAGNFAQIQPQLTSILNAWNIANPSATADRVVGVVDSSVSDGTASGCAGGYAGFGAKEAWVRVDPNANNIGAILSMELGHTLVDVPSARSRTGSLYHSRFTESDNYVDAKGNLIDANRAYNTAAGSYDSTDRTVMYAADSNWTTDNVDYEALDYGLIRCQLGGAPTSDCTTSGSIGTGTGAAQSAHYAVSGSVGPTDAVANVAWSGFSDSSVFPAPDPNRTTDYNIVQRDANGGIVRSDPLNVRCDSSDHDSDSDGGGLPGKILNPNSTTPVPCFFSEAVDSDATVTTIVELWRGPAIGTCVVGVGGCLFSRSTHTQPPTTVDSAPAPGPIKNYTNTTGANDTEAALSPDGSAVAWRRNIDPTGSILVAPRSKASPTAVPQPDRNNLLFVSDRSGRLQVWSMRGDGANVQQLTNSANWSFEPQYSPNGSQLVFTSDRDKNSRWQIYTASADGSNQVNLTNDLSKSDQGGSWTPDGSQIIYSSANVDPGGGKTCTDIYIRNADGTGTRRQVTNTPTMNEWNPVVSPDGSEVAYSAVPCAPNGDNSGTGDIWVTNLVTHVTRKLTDQDDTDDSYPEWSTDSSTILFERFVSGAYQVFTMSSTDGSGRLQLTTDGSNEQPAYDKNGRIYFTSTRDGNRELYSMNQNGTGQTRITNNAALDQDPDPSPALPPTPDQSHPAWSPDSQNIAYIVGGDLYRVHIDRLGGAGGTTFSGLKLLAQASSDVPLNHPTWSRDGSTIYYGNGGDIMSLPAGGGAATLVVTNGAEPSASQTPGDNRIAFSRTTLAGEFLVTNIWTVDPAVPNSENLVHEGQEPSWGPNGKIAYTFNNEIHVISPDGTNDSTLVSSTPAATQPSLIGNALAFTRDGLPGTVTLKDIYVEDLPQRDITVTATPNFDPSVLSLDVYDHCSGINYPLTTAMPPSISGSTATWRPRIDTSFTCDGGKVVLVLSDGFDRWNITPTGGGTIALTGADQAPVATINAPLLGKHLLQYSPIPINVSAKDPEGGQLSGNSIELKVTDPGGATTTIGHGNTAVLPNAAFPFNAAGGHGWVPGTYTLTAIATDSAGNTDTAMGTLTIDADANDDGLADAVETGPGCQIDITDPGAAFADGDGDGIPNIDDPHPCSPDPRSETTAPTLTVTHAPADDANGQINAQPVVNVDAADDGGLRSVVCTLDGSSVALAGADTVWSQPEYHGSFQVTGYGQHAISCTATDEAYNSTLKNDTVWIVYKFVGFLSPVNNPPTLNTGTAGKTYPVKWQLFGTDGQLVGDLSTIAPNPPKFFGVSCRDFSSNPTDPLETLTSGNTTILFDGSQFIENWQTPKTPGCYVFDLALTDGTHHTFDVKLK